MFSLSLLQLSWFICAPPHFSLISSFILKSCSWCVTSSFIPCYNCLHLSLYPLSVCRGLNIVFCFIRLLLVCHRSALLPAFFSFFFVVLVILAFSVPLPSKALFGRILLCLGPTPTNKTYQRNKENQNEGFLVIFSSFCYLNIFQYNYDCEMSMKVVKTEHYQRKNNSRCFENYFSSDLVCR